MAFLSRLTKSAKRRERVCVGVLSGTSADAAEAAVCRIRGSGARLELQLVSHVTRPFARALGERILTVSTPQELSALDFALGEQFALAALAAIRAAGMKPDDVDVIGSHGQTMAHLPKRLTRTPSTLQIGQPSVISARTGIPTIANFRVRDVAEGGEGAPLIPYADWALFRGHGVYRAFQNFGGIANVSVVGDALDETIAFDSGPGNMMLDAIVRRMTAGTKSFDRGGKLAMQGTPIPALLAEWMALPQLRTKPPRSLGRESFGAALIDPAWKKYGKRPNDLLATATLFTIEATARAYEKWILPKRDLEAIYVSGGGSRNLLLMEGLRARLDPIPLYPLDALGFPEEAKEAACFAVLASEWLSEQPQNVPAATGATRPVVLGQLSI